MNGYRNPSTCTFLTWRCLLLHNLPGLNIQRRMRCSHEKSSIIAVSRDFRRALCRSSARPLQRRYQRLVWTIVQAWRYRQGLLLSSPLKKLPSSTNPPALHEAMSQINFAKLWKDDNVWYTPSSYNVLAMYRHKQVRKTCLCRASIRYSLAW